MRSWFATLLLLIAAGATADERILSFHSDILVRPDGAIDVTETIRVRVEGNRIQRGIYRDQITDYRDRLGNRYEAAVDVLGVMRNVIAPKRNLILARLEGVISNTMFRGQSASGIRPRPTIRLFRS